LRKSVQREVPYYSLDGFLELRVEGKVGEVVGFKVGYYSRKIFKVFVIAPIPFLVQRNWKLSLTTPFTAFATAAGWLRQLSLLGAAYLFC
jgi:hypothetical protein